MPGFGQISPAQVFLLIGTPDAPIVIDVRLPGDAVLDPRVIPTARPCPHGDVASLARPGAHAVIACQGGRKLSEGAAALLRTHGMRAEVLAGGHLGWVADGLPLTPIARLEGTALWVTRHRPKIDRIACPWLIRRFIAPDARVLFVAPAEVAAVADRFGATPFDIEGVDYTHRGDTCTFDTLIADFGLAHPALDRLAAVVRAADTDRHDMAPQAAGLLALSVGLSRMYRDDLAQLDAATPLYDAPYRWARDGYDEGHDWPAGAQP